MGILDPPSDIEVSVETARGGSGVPRNRTGIPRFATNQFYGIENVEPNLATRKNVDNPKFSWPQQQHMDQSGRTYTIQRGYMRSLLTDPMVSLDSSVPNRRVFFQFNPLILQREVQQSVGTMMPLLQDPAQLLQPVPGTTQFSFQLMFNREHEVNKGIDDPDQDWLKLPGTGEKALVSQIGVLADLMMLDSITGQGLSEDMINSLVNRTKRQYENYNTTVTNQKTEDEEQGIDVEENSADYRTVELPKTDVEMKDIFNANIGNSAFLNPLPFRVMFSTLFMVEGVATSVSVSFNKFSKTMVPTQCVVTINMYALYLGFAKNRTFIYENLVNAAKEDATQGDSDGNMRPIVDQSIERFKTNGYISGDIYGGGVERFEVSGINVSQSIKDQASRKALTNVRLSFILKYKFTNTADGLDLPDNADEKSLTQGSSNNFKADHPLTTTKVAGLVPEGATLEGSPLFLDQIGKDKEGFNSLDGSTWNRYITFKVITVVNATNATSGSLVTQRFESTTVKNWKWSKDTTTGNLNPDDSDKKSKIGEFVFGGVQSQGTTGNQP